METRLCAINIFYGWPEAHAIFYALNYSSA